MSTDPAKLDTATAELMERVVIGGDLSKLTPAGIVRAAIAEEREKTCEVCGCDHRKHSR